MSTTGQASTAALVLLLTWTGCAQPPQVSQSERSSPLTVTRPSPGHRVMLAAVLIPTQRAQPSSFFDGASSAAVFPARDVMPEGLVTRLPPTDLEMERPWDEPLRPDPPLFGLGENLEPDSAIELPGATPARMIRSTPLWDLKSRGAHLWPECQDFAGQVWGDYKNYYTGQTGLELLAGVGVGAALANTSIDEHFDNWYQTHVRSSGTDDFAKVCKEFGNGQIVIPAFAGLALIGTMYDDTSCGSALGEFGVRVTRGYLVGAPPMLLMQRALGSGRPGETSDGSAWRPFADSNGVSGHAFMGAMPFITAAQMTENPWTKGCLYSLSVLPAWSRVNDHDHYLSQAVLGWWMAYLAASAVNRTDLANQDVTLEPWVTPDGAGVALIVRR